MRSYVNIAEKFDPVLIEEEVKRWIIGGDPRQHGFDFGLCTRQIVSDLISERFGVVMSVSGVGKLLKDWV